MVAKKESLDVLPVGSDDCLSFTMSDEYKLTTGHMAINLLIASWFLIHQKIVSANNPSNL